MIDAKIAYSPISWGVLDIPGSDIRQSNPLTYLDQIHQAGYAGTDLGPLGFLPDDPHALSDLLDERQIKLASAYSTLDFLKLNFEQDALAETQKKASLLSKVGDSTAKMVLGAKINPKSMRFRNAGRIKPEMGMLPMQWTTFARGVDEVARQIFEETGIKSVFHHHCGTVVETPGETGMLLDYTNPELVGVCLDTGHYSFAGGDPIRIFRAFSDRVSFVHLKDLDPKKSAETREQKWDYAASIAHGIFCELGMGIVDFSAVLAELEKINYSGWIVVEQDLAPGQGNPLQSARNNREYLAQLGY